MQHFQVPARLLSTSFGEIGHCAPPVAVLTFATLGLYVINAILSGSLTSVQLRPSRRRRERSDSCGFTARNLPQWSAVRYLDIVL